MGDSIERRHRPFGISLLVVLGYIQGVVIILGGFIVLLARTDARVRLDSGYTNSQLAVIGVVSMVFGVIYLIAAHSLGRGSRIMRFVLALLTVLAMIDHVFSLFRFGSRSAGTAIVGIVIDLIILYLLYSSQASREFFGDRP
jgi:hypothetical protein